MNNPIRALNDLFDAALNPMRACEAGIAPEGGDLCRDEGSVRWFETCRSSVSIVAFDGCELLGWFLDQWNGRHDYLIACHGYTGCPSDMASFARHAFDRGFKVLLPAARGHERNVGTGYIQMGWQDSADLLIWIQMIHRLDPEARIVLAGVSMGGAEVMMACGRPLPPYVCCAIEDCGYTSVWDELRYLSQSVLGDKAKGLVGTGVLAACDAVVKTRAGFGLREASAVRQLRHAHIPMLFIHGTEDTFVPFSMLDEVFQACQSSQKERLAVEGAAHAQSALVNPDVYWGTIDAFIARHLEGE